MANGRLDDLRILEIGEFRLFKGVLPEQTTRFSTGRRLEATGPGERPFDVAAVRAIVRDLRAGAFDLVVCYPPAAGIRRPGDGPVAGLARLLGTLLLRFRRFGPQVMRTRTSTPFAALDYADESRIGRHAHFLLDRCTRYFKRSLPPDSAGALLGPRSPFTSLASVHRSGIYQRNASKLLPISVGIPDAALADLPAVAPAKDTDLFFSGAWEHSTVRQRGRPLLDVLRERGVRVDVAPRMLPRREYLARGAKAWLAWSPEGYGWDCFRHYEMLAAGTVPVINEPTVQSAHPLVDRRHCRYYDPDGDHLVHVVLDALRNRADLTRMAAAGREHVLRHYTHRALCTYVAESCGVVARRSRSSAC